MRGADVLRPIIEDAEPTHPSLIDQHHQMDALFGVTNIPQAFWIDEEGTIVRGPEAAIPPAVMRVGPDGKEAPYGLAAMMGADPEPHVSQLRDWAEKGASSEHILSPDEVMAASQPRSMDKSLAAAHFELAGHLHARDGFTEPVLAHFSKAHELQPENITYKRQAYSAFRVSQGRTDDMALFDQIPHGDEDWPFVSDFDKDMALIGSPIRMGGS